MPWTERQRAMLAEMGLVVWGPPAQVPPPPDALAVAAPAEAEVAAKVVAMVATKVATKVATTAAALPAPPVFTAQPVETSPVAAMDWPELRDTVAACTACALCQGRRQTVFGVGHQHAHWMIVGEAPGEREDATGEPFVGVSGQLLDNMLRALGLTREAADPADPARQVYIANAVKCRPPGNRNPAPDELARCEPYLQRQIALVRPRIILAMGRFAVQSLLRSTEPIGRLRGRVHRYQGVPLVVTYHPAYLLRNLEDKARAWDDLCLAWHTVQGAGEPVIPATAISAS